MTRRRGRAARGQRLVAAVPHGHWKTTTLIAALDQQEVRGSMTLDGTVNRPAFEAFVQPVLTPTLRPGDLVVMDNLSSHQGPRVAELIHAAQAELRYRPPYSPDRNPIERAFSKIKPGLRSSASRTVAQLWRTMPNILDRVPPRRRRLLPPLRIHATGKVKML